ncbi:peptidoglycan DD-metalloendopeptidase family protein [Devosia sp. WQ 349]|uniref:murein hydrolase activator EnvC family protein n=1 Tax=Devosia sp. WQ 349K1 TaxID=2800329 RepID=UPI0019088CD7|nr:peptidoglycan DD-metalloendopeptidase family protein [Devosia sp. WQ 349K1]MBK1795538.1 peptidoglycan DD-metalloendopeptidase family protein [Devosia sp. WQ 349K1]
MPLRPARTVKTLLAGTVLAGLGVFPIFSQDAEPIPNPAAELRPALDVAQPAGEAGLDLTTEQPVTPPVEVLPPEEPQLDVGNLEEVEASLTISRERIDALKAEIEAMEGDRTQQNAALIGAAQRVKLAEIEIADVEERLSELIVKEMDVRGRLDGADAEVANVLAALQRISLHPPPALIVDPSDALGSARGAVLISAIVPQLRAKADSVSADLKELTDIKVAAMAEEETLRANQDVLEEEQLRIATLITARKTGINQRTTQLQAEEEAAVALAEKAATLRELISALSDRANASTRPASPDEDLPRLSPEAVQLAFANTSRTQPAVPFPLARGYLTQPANGTLALDWGANDGKGGVSQGQYLITRPTAQVLAPSDGWVLYKGPYLNYGEIIILNTGDGYTTLLAGLESITTEIGQFVQMGEPLGTMGSRTIGRTVTTGAGNNEPTLYIELRRDNEPFDPNGWWATIEQTG